MTTEQIISIVCKVFNVSTKQLTSKSRAIELIDARCIAIRLMAEYNDGDKRTITNSIGLAVCMYYHYINRFDKLHHFDKKIREKYDRCKQSIKDTIFNNDTIEYNTENCFCIANCGSICLEKCEKFNNFVELITNK